MNNATSNTQNSNSSNVNETQEIGDVVILVQKRNGSVAEFDKDRIRLAIEKAFRAKKNVQVKEELDPFSTREVKAISEEVIKRVLALVPASPVVGIEQIQDLVEILLMQAGHYSVAKGYILYREQRAKARVLREEENDVLELQASIS